MHIPANSQFVICACNILINKAVAEQGAFATKCFNLGVIAMQGFFVISGCTPISSPSEFLMEVCVIIYTALAFIENYLSTFRAIIASVRRCG